MSSDRIVILASYNTGPEYEEKQQKAKELNKEGLNVNLFHLLTLTWDDKLPNDNVELRMITNLEKCMQYFNPSILAIHNGLTINLKKDEFVGAIEKFKRKYPSILLLLEYMNKPEKSSNFKNIYGFQEWSEEYFLRDHPLYDIIWKPKI
ncbi:hypothetical protein [Spirosoma spitsbergense]|uniref:hypothetical protein n=1 Tax=Spirosoma spitsbergense TaxID=431554 RepID=UPI00037A4AD8|nr:hypothetical protein [Spirosoma spitsbergense]